MKIYNVVVIHHPGNNNPNYDVYAKVFTDYLEAMNYMDKRQKEFPLKWNGPYNHVDVFEQKLEF